MNTNSNSSNASDDQPSSILIVEDDEIFRQRLARAMTDRGLEVRTASDAPAALVEARKGEPPELAVVDLRMPGGSGPGRGARAQGAGAGDAYPGADRLRQHRDRRGGDQARRHQLPDQARRRRRDPERAAGGLSPDAAQPSNPALPPPSLARTEWEHIQRVLADCSGNISEAARRLGLHRRSLQRKLGKNPPRTSRAQTATIVTRPRGGPP